MGTQFSTPRRHLYALSVYVVLVAAAFGSALAHMLSYGIEGETYSHVVLVPIVALFLAHRRREKFMPHLGLSRRPTVLLLAAAATVLAFRHAITGAAWVLTLNDELALEMLAFVLCLWAGAMLWLGTKAVKRLVFPLGFLVFMVPMPSLVEQSVTVSLLHGTRFFFSPLLRLTGTPFLESGMVYTMPGLTVEIAEACSGIRSTLVLFIFSLLAGELCLRTPWRRAILILLVYPVAALRNALRVLMISLATIHVDPDAIYGPLHRHGGPPLFVLSLVPFLLILMWMVKSERSRLPPQTSVETARKRQSEEEEQGDREV